MKIKGIIFDLWGTLAYTDPHIGEFIKRINKFLNEDQIKIHKELRREWYKKEITSDAFFLNLIKEAKLDKIHKKRFIEIWGSQLNYKKIYPETVEVLKELKNRKLKLAMLSNTTPIAEIAVKNLKLDKFFNVIIYSFREGITKPNKDIFKIALKRLELNPEEVLVIGDQLNTDKAGADSLNIKFVLIDRDNKIDYKDKINNLKQLLDYIK